MDKQTALTIASAIVSFLVGHLLSSHHRLRKQFYRLESLVFALEREKMDKLKPGDAYILDPQTGEVKLPEIDEARVRELEKLLQQRWKDAARDS